MSRFRASFIHLLISASVMASVFAVVLLIWYPSPTFFLQGAWPPTRTMLFVDIVLGPLLTLVVYKAGKKSLRFDLSVIAIIQIIALVYGTMTLYKGRPAVIAATESRFRIVRVVDMVDREWAPVAWEDERLFGRPVLVYSSPDGLLEHHLRPENYRPLEEHLVEVRATALALPKILADDAAKAALEAVLAGTELVPSDVMIFPLKGYAEFGSIVLNYRTGELVGMSRFEFEDVPGAVPRLPEQL